MCRKILLLYVLSLLVQMPLYASEHIAYLQQTDGFWQVWMMDVNGESRQQLTGSSWDKSRISWYPDNRYLLANGSQGQMSVIDVITKQEALLEMPVSGAVDAVISPDGGQIAFSLSVADSIDNNHIWIMDVESSELIKLTNMDGLQHEPVWSADGSSIYYLSGKGDQYHDIWRIHLADKTIEQITVNSLYNFDLAVSRSGLVAFSSNRETGDYEIWAYDEGGYLRLTDHEGLDARPSFSADGESLVFESYRDGELNVWLRHMSDGTVKQLTEDSGGARQPVFSY